MPILEFAAKHQWADLVKKSPNKLTLAKMETLKTYAIDSVVLGGTKAFQPKNLIEKFRASEPERF